MQYGLAEECLQKAKDLEGLLLIYQASGNEEGIKSLAQMAMEKEKNNVAFICHLLCGDVEESIDILCSTNRAPEAAFMARTFLPSKISDVVTLWKESLIKSNKKKVAEAIANPVDYENLFPDIKYARMVEYGLKAKKDKGPIPATDYLEWKDVLDLDLIAGKGLHYFLRNA
jgi:coatomer subunit beta'